MATATATVNKPVRLVNPGKKRRRLTLLQKLHFGSKRQRAAAHKKVHSRNPGKGHTKGHKPRGGIFSYGSSIPVSKRAKKAVRRGELSKAKYYASSSISRGKKYYSPRLPNVGEIITIIPKNSLSNPSSTRKERNKLNNMAKRRRKSGISHAAAVKRGRKAARSRARRHHSHSHRNPGRVRNYRRRSNPSKTIIRYRNPRRRVHRYRRNPSMVGFKSGIGQAVGVIGGAFVTSMIMGYVPAQFNTGIIGYVATAVVATMQGQAVGKLLKNPNLGKDMTIGGFVYLALRIMSDMFPSISLPFKLSGLGNVIGPSSFWTPQVPLNGSMGQFVAPAALTGAIPAAPMAKAGMGMVRRVGRMR